MSQFTKTFYTLLSDQFVKGWDISHNLPQKLKVWAANFGTYKNIV